LKLRCFEPAHNGCFLKIPELFHHHTLHTTRTCKPPQYSFNLARFVSCFNFSPAFPQAVSNTSPEFLHDLRGGDRCHEFAEGHGALLVALVSSSRAAEDARSRQFRRVKRNGKGEARHSSLRRNRSQERRPPRWLRRLVSVFVRLQHAQRQGREAILRLLFRSCRKLT
jgi:hypothetical protein